MYISHTRCTESFFPYIVYNTCDNIIAKYVGNVKYKLPVVVYKYYSLLFVYSHYIY